MKNLFYFLLLILISTSCGKDEMTYIESLEGEYIGSLKTFECTLPLNEISSENCTTTISKTSDTGIDISIDQLSENLYTFSGIVNADSTITIPEFTQDQEMLEGSASNNSKLRINLGGDCIIFESQIAIIVFEEN